jgi:hypothetical protein
LSWDELEAITADVRPVEQQREDLARLCLRVFATEDGQKLLAWLRQMYVDVPVAVPGTDPSHAFFAEGQRTVVRELIARIHQARNL